MRVRRRGKPVILVANKAEGRGHEASLMEAFELGFGDPLRPGVCLLRQERTGSAGPCEPGASRADRTPEGLFDLGHNVSEWTATLLGPRAVIRGGNWTDRTMEPVTTQRLARDPGYAGPTVGFRCAADPR